jgi:hypothetical protein
MRCGADQGFLKQKHKITAEKKSFFVCKISRTPKKLQENRSKKNIQL